MTEYVIADRTNGKNYAISISDSQIVFTETVSAASDEPIVLDYSVPGSYYKIFIDDEQPGIEVTATVQNDEVLLLDAISGQTYKLIVDDGQFAYIVVAVQTLVIVKTVLESLITKTIYEQSAIEKQPCLLSRIEKFILEESAI